MNSRRLSRGAGSIGNENPRFNVKKKKISTYSRDLKTGLEDLFGEKTAPKEGRKKS
jgi:hypothetical protein